MQAFCFIVTDSDCCYSNLDGFEASTTIEFGLSVQANLHGFNASTSGNSRDGPGMMTTLTHHVQGGLPLDSWTHIVATYNGFLMSLYLNGELVAEQDACARPPCGALIYPLASGADDECCADTQLALGSYRNGKLGQSSAHTGVMSHVRILKSALSPISCAEVYAASRARSVHLRNAVGVGVQLNRLDDADYWSLASQAAPRSPSFDFSGVHTEEVQVLGSFQHQAVYRIVFAPLHTTTPASGSVGIDETETVGECRSLNTSLACKVPASDAYRRTGLSVQKLSHEGEWLQVWCKVCLHTMCGLLSFNERPPSGVVAWWAENGRLRSDLSGALTVFRFMSKPSLIFLRHRLTGKLEPLQVLGSATACVHHLSPRLPYLPESAVPSQKGSCFYDARTCSSGASQGAPCNSDAECPGSVCSNLNAFKVRGVASVTGFRHDSKQFLFVSNFWDGYSMQVSSPLYRVFRDAHLGDGKGVTLQMIQEVGTHGIRDALHVELPAFNLSMLALANFAGDVRVYSLLHGVDHNPIETTDDLVLNLGVARPTALARFHVQDRLMLAVACYSTGLNVQGHSIAPSAVFEILPNDDNESERDREAPIIQRPRMTARRVARLHTPSASDVEVFSAGGQSYLFFACRTEAPSPLYRVYADASGGVSVHLVQSVPCSGASKAHSFFAGSPMLHPSHGYHADHRHPYLVVSQPFSVSGGQPVIYRWNGTMLLSDVTDATLPQDSAGGQTLVGQRYIEAVLALPVSGAAADSSVVDAPALTANVQLLLGANTLHTAGHKLLPNSSESSSWSGSHEHIAGQRAPSAILACKDGAIVLVACAGSRSIVAFQRNPSSGLLAILPQGGYATDFAQRGLDRNDASPRDEETIGGEPGQWLQRERLGYPLRGVSAMALSPDGLFLYSTSVTDNLLAVFALNTSTYALHLRQVVADHTIDELSASRGGGLGRGSAGGGRGLLGARALAVSTSGNSVYVAGGRAHSLSLWSRAPSDAPSCPGCLTFVHRLRQGERRPDSFRHLPARRQSSHRGSPWAVGSKGRLAATDGVSLIMHGQPYFIIAESSLAIAVPVGRQPGAVLVYRINDRVSSQDPAEKQEQEDTEQVLTQVDTIAERAAALEAFSIASSPSFSGDALNAGVPSAQHHPATHFLVLATALSWQAGHDDHTAATGGQVKVYQWTRGGLNAFTHGFEFHHVLPMPSDAAGQPLQRMYASSLRAFPAPDGQQLLAVAYSSAEGGGGDMHAPWCLYRWLDQRPSPRLPTGARQKPAFELLQCVPASGVLDIETISVAETRLVAVSSQTPEDGRVDIFVVGADSSRVSRVQVIEADGVSDASLVRVPGPHAGAIVLLVVGIRRKPGALNLGPRTRPLAIYDQISRIYRWKPGAEAGDGVGEFVWHQDLTGHDFPSVMDDFRDDETWSVFEASAAQSLFCGFDVAGDDCSVGDDSSVMVPHLRGVTGTHSFSLHGERHLYHCAHAWI